MNTSGIAFGLSEEQQLLQQMVRKFAVDVVRPAARDWEHAGEVSDAAARSFAELGVTLLDAPEELGGQGLSLLDAALAHEELSFGDPGAAVALWAPHLVWYALRHLGDDAQQRRLMNKLAAGGRGAIAWSEPRGGAGSGFSVRAERCPGGYKLSGSKRLVLHAGRADLYIVFAQLDGEAADWSGTAAFAVDAAAAGDTLRAGERHELLGLSPAWAADLHLTGCFVPDADRLLGGADFLDGLRRFWACAALITAARQVGLARAAYEYALDYTQERVAFGKPVAHFQANAFALADMLMEVDSARWLLWKAASTADHDKGGVDARAAAVAALHANQAAWRVADSGVQLLGGAGFIRDFPVEKWLRDTRALSLLGGSDELHREVMAAHDLREKKGVPPKVVLPDPVLQPILT